jgi:cytochrome c oxidase subunit 2
MAWNTLEKREEKTAEGEYFVSDMETQSGSVLRLLPDQMSTLAGNVDSLFYFIVVLCTIFFVIIVSAMVYFVVKFKRRSESDQTPMIKGNHTLEIVWSVIPGVLLIAIFVWGFVDWMRLGTVPPNALNVRVEGYKWAWSFVYPEGITSGELVVPAGRPVKLTMSSKDLLHSFYVADFRIKRDVIPGRYTVQWFEAPSPGEHWVQCTEYCGTSHSKMIAKVKVVPQDQFDEWIATGGGMGDDVPLADLGKMLYEQRGCVACHSIDGSRQVGPSFKGIWGTQTKHTDGTSSLVDDNYVRTSILAPNEVIVEGYSPVMPSFQGQLNDKQIAALIEYIKSLGN